MTYSVAGISGSFESARIPGKYFVSMRNAVLSETSVVTNVLKFVESWVSSRLDLEYFFSAM